MRRNRMAWGILLAAILFVLPAAICSADAASDEMDRLSSQMGKMARGKDIEAEMAKTGTKKERIWEAKEEPSLRVGLAERLASASVVSDADYVIRDAESGQALQKCAAGKTAVIGVASRRLVVNGKAVPTQKLRLAVADARTSRYLSFAGKTYHGELEIFLSEDGTITVVNEVGLDDYVGGVISNEMSPEWPFEALKAQAVAARTFAMYSKGTHEEKGYDVCASTHCQVYGGITSESALGLRAVSATRGEILTHEGAPIYAAFHAASGGMTAGSEENGGSALPYLVPVRDAQDLDTLRHWQKDFSASELIAKLREAGFGTGMLKAIELTPLDIGRGAADRYPSGRVVSVRFIGARQTAEVPGPKLRRMLGLPSTLFEIRLGAKGASVPNATGRIDLKGTREESVVFDGSGSGHGIGLSQWGAKALAAKKGYRDILRHYYKDVTLEWLF